MTTFESVSGPFDFGRVVQRTFRIIGDNALAAQEGLEPPTFALGMGRQTPIFRSGFNALGPAPDYRFGTIRGLAHRVQILKDIT